MSIAFDFVLFSVLFFVGSCLAIVWFSVTILPLFYGLPRSSIWVLRGWVGWRAPAPYLVVPILWNVVLFLIALALKLFLPTIAAYILQSPALVFGIPVGLVISTGRAIFVASARDDMRDDFLSAMRPYLTPEGVTAFEESHFNLSGEETAAPEHDDKP